ncbi:hypothetical protein [Phyllobacterium sp. YR531]|uniref:hypothetical protein n=1 Tax=Phyllobacterium sp. YR531 TaxID=1144343 RepID=UPI00026F7607|nr:hypothetical protein [Phyllobacterium sp. YR531]EJM98895.1 hypothetical protein PMI41_04658 [Phyllobacterium sp. YR531]
MTTPTVPQDIYLRHEREWQMLRQAIAEKKPANDEKQAMENLAPRRKTPLTEQHQ